MLLTKRKDHKLYVEITAKETEIHTMRSDFSKKAVVAVQYNLTYTYEYLPSREKKHFEDEYVVADNGLVFNTKATREIKVGEITFRVEAQ